MLQINHASVGMLADHNDIENFFLEQDTNLKFTPHISTAKYLLWQTSSASNNSAYQTIDYNTGEFLQGWLEGGTSILIMTDHGCTVPLLTTVLSKTPDHDVEI